MSLDLGMKWFEVHADQRMKSVRFFLLCLGFCIIGFSASWRDDTKIIALILGVFLLVLTVLFHSLDKRTSQLVKVAEDLIAEASAEIYNKTGLRSVDVVAASNNKGENRSYSVLSKSIYFMSGVLAGLMILISMVK